MDYVEQQTRYHQYDGYEEYDEYECEDIEQPPSKRGRLETGTGCDESYDGTELTSVSRFADLSKKFKTVEVCDMKVDDHFASTVNDVFRAGMDSDKYEHLVKDEVCPRPSNCEGLVTAKMNKLVWDVMSPQSKTTDKKMQSICTSIVKAGVCLTKTMDNAAKLEKLLSDKELDHDVNLEDIINGCHDAMGLLGHANYQSNMLRRDLLRPELKREYAHLCTHSLPVTQELFGDDVSKTAREIEDTAKIRDRMSGQITRGGFRGRPWNRGRFRGPLRGRGFGYGPKHLQRRGGTPRGQHQKF